MSGVTPTNVLRMDSERSGAVMYYNEPAGSTRERASYNGSIEASQASDVGSIPIARSISTQDKGLVGF